MQSLIFTDCVDLVGAACPAFSGSKKYISTGAVETDHIVDAEVEIVDFARKPTRANLVATTGDVLFAKMQGTKKTLLITDALAEHIYSTGFCAVRPKKGILTGRCLYHLLTSEMFLAQKDKHCSGATQKAITNAGLEKIVIKVPEIEEQEPIADLLDTIKQVITQRQNQLIALDTLIKARFIEMFGDPYKNNKQWKMNTFGDICTVRQGLQIPISKRLTKYEDDCYEYITVQYLHGGKDREYIKSPKKTVICTTEDILMTRTGNTGMVITNVAGVFHNNFFLIDFDRDRYNKDFLVQYLKLDLIQAEIIKRAGTSTIPDLNHGDFYKIQIYEPPMELQKNYYSFIQRINKSKSAVQASLAKDQLLFDSLMQKYFG